MRTYGVVGSASYRSEIGQHTRGTPRWVGGSFQSGWALIDLPSLCQLCGHKEGT